MFPGRHFPPDGHMVGSIGECLVADAYNLQLLAASHKGFDATTPSGKKVEIKATQSDRVAFRHEPDYAIAIKLEPDGTFEESYSGPGNIVWSHFYSKPLPSNGQYSISLNQVRQLNETVDLASRIEKIE